MERFILIVSGPSGVGKTSVVNELLKVRRNIAQVISYTTREIRNNEIEGVHYNFINEKTFKILYDNNDFIESAEVFGNRYGISKSSIQDALNKGKHALLVINWRGFVRIKEVFQDRVKGVFLLPGSVDELRSRILKRQTEHIDMMEHRLSMAEEDMKHSDLYDHVIVNKNINQTVFEMAKIFDNLH